MSTKSVPSSDVEQTQVPGGPSLACRQTGGQTPADQAVVKIGTGVGTPFRVAKPLRAARPNSGQARCCTGWLS